MRNKQTLADYVAARNPLVEALTLSGKWKRGRCPIELAGRFYPIRLDLYGSPEVQPIRVLARNFKAVCDRVVLENLGLVHKAARKLRCEVRFEIEDAEQVGNIELIRASTRFDPTFGYQFSTFAVNCINRGLWRWAQMLNRGLKNFQSASEEYVFERADHRDTLEAYETADEVEGRLGRVSGRAFRIVVGRTVGLTLRDMASREGLSPERIRQIRERAMEILRQ